MDDEVNVFNLSVLFTEKCFSHNCLLAGHPGSFLWRSRITQESHYCCFLAILYSSKLLRNNNNCSLFASQFTPAFKKHVQNTQFWKAPCCDDTKCTVTSLRLVATSACRCWSESLYGRKKEKRGPMCFCVSESLLWPCLVLDNWSSMSAPLTQELNKNIC